MYRKPGWVGLVLGVAVAGWLGVAPAEEKNKPVDGPKFEEAEEALIEGTETPEDEKHEGALHRVMNFGKLSIFGYGELHYNQFRGNSQDNEVDFHRFVIGVGYDFTDRIRMRAELDFEHAFQEPELEFAYVDFDLYKDMATGRAGAILVPMGYLNEHHEPPLFYSVERPEVYRVIIPTTWTEGGAGFHGRLPWGFTYELYGLTSLDAVKVNTAGTGFEFRFNGTTGFRGGRTKVGFAPAKDFAAAYRLQNTGVPGLRVGTSGFFGNTAQGQAGVDGAFLSMLEADAKYGIAGFELDTIFVYSNLGEAGSVNNVILGVAPTTAAAQLVAKAMYGWYVEGAYHLLTAIAPHTKQDVVVFSRYERYNTQYKMPAGFTGDPANDRTTWTSGISYLPIPQVALKVDYMANWNKANGGIDQFNAGIGFYY